MGGVGRGALAARYVLAKAEQDSIDHDTTVYVSYNGTAPSSGEGAELKRLGGWPVRPLKLKLVSADFASELSDEDFDEPRPAPRTRESH
ncbi:hypothetical protein [Streptomyces sp. NPDC059533]|uniref:hypothetical protein n=1 Tax=unclassified Streptomyces TaxID=2593676 RepID=UPI0036AD8FA6